MIDYTYKSELASGDVNSIQNPDGDKLPLLFAKQICIDCGLWKSLNEKDPYIRTLQTDQLKNFQKMSISCSFENSLIAYHGTELNEEQKDALYVIHKATRSWLKGEVVGVLMNKISDKRITNKDFAASISIIVDQLTEQNGERSVSSQKTKELVVRLANMDKPVSIAGKG